MSGRIRAADDADLIHRRMAEERAWAAAGDRGCHKLPGGHVCADDVCPVCRPLAFKAKFSDIAALIPESVQQIAEDDWSDLRQRVLSAPLRAWLTRWARVP